MKRVFLLVVPLLIAIIIFFGILFFLDRNSGKGALQVTSIPQSKVYLDSRLLGTTPLSTNDPQQMLNVGDYAVKLVPNSGSFRPFEGKITINKGTLTAVDRTFADNGSSNGSIISLSPLNDKKDVEVLVISMPSSANVFLDSNPVGITPLLLKRVSESDHDLRLTLDGYEDKSIRIKTALGFRLSSLVYLGISIDLSVSPVASAPATLSLTPALASVFILNTPTGFLRVRESNFISSSEIDQVKPGETYELVTEKEGWFEIKLNSEETGWISAQYAAKK